MYDKDENSEARFFARMYSRMMMFPTFEKAFSALNMSDEQRAVSLVHMVDTVLSIESLTNFKFQLLNIKRLGVQHRGRTRPGDYRLFGDILLSTLIEMYGPRRITPTIVKSIKKSFIAIGEVMQLGENENKPIVSGSEVQSIKLRSRRKSMGDVMKRPMKKQKKKKERPRTGRGGRKTHWPETRAQTAERRERTTLKRYRSKSGIAESLEGQNHEAFIEEMKQEKEKAEAKARRAEKRQWQRRKTFSPNASDKDLRSKDWLLEQPEPLDCTEEEKGKTQIQMLNELDIKEEMITEVDEAVSQAHETL